MALTNFGRLTDEELTIWSRDFWSTARNASFINGFVGKSSNSVIQRVTELTKNQKGARAVMTLVADLVGDGVTGDYTLKGREESMQSFDQVINIDQLRHGTQNEGKMAEQRSVVNFRMQARDKLAYWIADRCDQLALQAMGGVSYEYTPKGARRPQPSTKGIKFSDLEFAADVRAPTANRHVRWDASSGSLIAGANVHGDVASGDRLSYKTLVRLKEFANNNYVKGISTGGNQEMFYLFVTPSQFADLQLDTDFLANVRNAGVRGDSNPLFRGVDRLLVDGVLIIHHRHVPDVSQALTGSSSNKAAAGYKWGANANVVGGRALFCGAQALGMADLSGSAMWAEESDDYNNMQGIAVGKMLGFLKPQYNAAPMYTSKEDFGVIAVDTAQGA